MEDSAYQRAKDLKQAFPHWGSLSFFIALAMSQLFIFVNFKGEGLDKTVAQFYIMAPSLILSYMVFATYVGKTRFKLDDLKLVPMAAFGIIGFLLSWAITLFLLGYLWGQEFGDVQITSLTGIILIQVLFVACSEELMFQYALPTYLRAAWSKSWWIVPVVLSQASFSIFHFGVYGGNTFSLIVAFIFGMIMYGAYHVKIGEYKLGLGCTIGAHAAYNLVLVGVLAGPGHIIFTSIGG